MGISDLSNSSANNLYTTSPLMERKDIAKGMVDHKGRPVNRFLSGGWKSASYIIGVELTERFAFYGMSSNLITYLTDRLGQSTANAAENVNIFGGTARFLPLVGAFVADSFLGRYKTIIIASVIYFLGLGLLTLSAMLNSTDAHCQNTRSSISCSPPRFQVFLFFSSLYLVAVGVGGHKPCAQAFGADQFDAEDPEESKARGSFFNWWYFGASTGILITTTVSVYIQDNLSWSLGFGIPCIVMLASLLIFLLGSRTYRYSIRREERNPFSRICGVVGRATQRTWTKTNPALSLTAYTSSQNSRQLRFLDKALLRPDGLLEDQDVCSVHDVEETKALFRLVPVWLTSLAYAVVFAQTSTFFTKQGATMDRTIVSGLQIPAASLQCFIGFSIIPFVPMYDRIFVPVLRSVTGERSGITILQRIGTGMILSIISMVTAAIVEIKRLETAEQYGLVDRPDVTLPISVWWLVPQYMLCGLADVFTLVGLQEFFYDEVPEELRSLGVAFYHSLIGIGSFLSSFLISVIDTVTAGKGIERWFSNNLNQAHLDYFYWLLAGLSAAGFTAYIYFAKSYIHRRESTSQNLL